MLRQIVHLSYYICKLHSNNEQASSTGSFNGEKMKCNFLKNVYFRLKLPKYEQFLVFLQTSIIDYFNVCQDNDESFHHYLDHKTCQIEIDFDAQKVNFIELKIDNFGHFTMQNCKNLSWRYWRVPEVIFRFLVIKLVLLAYENCFGFFCQHRVCSIQDYWIPPT